MVNVDPEAAGVVRGDVFRLLNLADAHFFLWLNRPPLFCHVVPLHQLVVVIEHFVLHNLDVELRLLLHLLGLKILADHGRLHAL